MTDKKVIAPIGGLVEIHMSPIEATLGDDGSVRARAGSATRPWSHAG
jgi:hypothetical protein